MLFVNLIEEGSYCDLTKTAAFIDQIRQKSLPSQDKLCKLLCTFEKHFRQSVEQSKRLEKVIFYIIFVSY